MKKIFTFGNDTESIRILPEMILRLNEYAEIDCVREICEYSGEHIKLSLGKIYVTFCGSSLEICSLDCERLSISGNIISISFST